MRKRTVLRRCGLIISGTLTGCNSNQNETETLDPSLDIFVVGTQTDDGWELAIDVVAEKLSIHDVTLLAFASTGEEVCRKNIGDLIVPGVPGHAEKTATVECDEFPSIVTATAGESPCEGAQIALIYWVGTDDQKGSSETNEEILWKSTNRRCNEPLPPERVLEKVNATGDEETDTS